MARGRVWLEKMTDEEALIAINDIVKDRFEESEKDVLIWWEETGLDAFSGRTPLQVIDDGYAEDLLQYARTNYGS